MAELRQCDTCKKISPNEKGLFIANDWLEVTVSDRASRNNHSREVVHLVCDECMSRGIKLSDKGVKADG